MRISWAFNPLSIALISAVAVAFHLRYTADKAANMAGGLVAHLMFPGLLYLLLLSLSICAAKYFRVRYMGLNAISIAAGFFGAYAPFILILMRVRLAPI